MAIMKGAIVIANVNLDKVGIENGYYGSYSKCGDGLIFNPVGREFWIKEILVNFESGDIKFILETQYSNKTVDCEILRKDIDAKGVQELRAKGFDVKMSDIGVFQFVLDNLEEEYLENNDNSIYHTGVGWEEVTKKNNINGLKAPLRAVYKHHYGVGNIKSKYDGNLDIKPRGKKNKQIEFIKKEISGYTPGEVAVSIGLSAIVNGLISDKSKTHNLIIHLWGDSSTGKTTAAQLAISVAGIPDLQGMTLMKSWNATYNAIIACMKSNRGMPVVLDEISKFVSKDLSTLVYSLSDGCDKTRLNRDATIRKVDKTDSFSTTIISTGEASMLSKCNNNTGLNVRVIEINSKFTKDARQADRIKLACDENCGWLAPALASYMEEKGLDYIKHKHKYWVDKYCESTTIDTIKDRVSADYSTILTAAELANEAFSFGFDLDEILDFFISNEEDNTPERNLAETAYDKLIDFSKVNSNHFTVFNHKGGRQLGDGDIASNPVYGRIDKGINTSINGKQVVGEVCFMDYSFKDIVHKLGFEDEKVVLKKLKEVGYLNCEHGKLYRKRKLRKKDGSATKMYILYEFKNEEDVESKDEEVELEVEEVEFEDIDYELGDEE